MIEWMKSGSDILKSLKKLFYIGKIWTYELKFLLSWVSDWKIQQKQPFQIPGLGTRTRLSRAQTSEIADSETNI